MLGKKWNMKRKKNKKEKTPKQEEVTQDKETLVDEATEEQLEETPLSKEEQLESDLAEAQNKHLRLLAEFENYRNRNAKIQMEMAESCAGKTLVKILPILDDFERAAQSEEFSEGVTLVYQKLNKTLEQLGVKPMETNEQPFDSDKHEAITEIPAPNDDLKGKIVDTIEKGYTVNDKILRFAKVVVGK